MTTLTSPITSAKPSDLVFVSQTNDLVTDSFHVATFFGKQHKDVLRKIKDLDCSLGFAKRHFTLCHKNNELQNGKLQPFYQMTKNGFVFLVMGFTGKRAGEIKERYINAFDEMADKLSKKANCPAPVDPIDSLNFQRQRFLVTVEKGRVINKQMLSDDDLMVNRNNLDYYLRDPEIFSIDQLIKAASTFHLRVDQFMQAKLMR